ncbi:PREDICTED: acyl-CoA-binding domain-containing protein 4 isoform X3 [Galeopterus variegatus]|uniref:Acyl-CoA-binding domain-containing protein 4 isoform X3 n=1 Tax=Galeopterus variegatus TaxID=482537 RepID=A0ABM0RAX4_GALVR|nr:PREDICTED: acyl-CoA-binding domain-containing protein 4 isoform X3 [Galeopterus variegatus]
MGTENESPEPDCQKQFQAAVSVIQNLPKNGSYRPSYEEMLRFYSYYKQATMGPCLVPRPGFWDPIGRYKWDAWNSLGKMSREEAMTAYITEMKLVAQKVIDTVPLGEVAEDMFDYFEPLYRVIPDMPRPPEAFLRRVTGWKGQVLNGDVQAVPEPPSLPKEPAPPSPESQPPRDLDSEVFCDSLEQLESELICDSLQQVWTEQSGAPRGESDTRNSPVSSREKGAAAQCSALAPQALRSHAALLLPVALLRPVALPTVSDSEEAPLPGKLGLGPGPGSVVGWEARREARRPGHRGRSEQAPAAGGERRFRSLPSPVARRPPRTLRTSSLKIHLQMNVSLNKRKP